jgi:hypothetical protein
MKKIDVDKLKNEFKLVDGDTKKFRNNVRSLLKKYL